MSAPERSLAHISARCSWPARLWLFRSALSGRLHAHRAPKSLWIGLRNGNPELVRAASNKQSYLDAKAAFNRGDLDACMAYYAEDHQVRSQDMGTGRRHIHGYLAGMREAWGDLQILVEHAVAEGDWVMGHCRSIAVHNRTVLGIRPTGRRIEVSFWDLHRFDGSGLIAETWNISDRAAIMSQLSSPDGPRA